MEEYSINELGGLISVSAGAIATILFALQKSSCVDINCLCFKCHRDPNLIKKNINNGNDTPRINNTQGQQSKQSIPISKP